MLAHSLQLDLNVSSVVLMCVISSKQREVTEESGSQKTHVAMYDTLCEIERSSLQSPKYTPDKVQVSELGGFLTPPSYVTAAEL